MRGAIYVRVSTDDQRDNGDSIDSQLRMIKEYCEKNDYSIITSDFTTVILSGCSGKSDSVVFHLLLEQPVWHQHHWAIFTQLIMFHFGINY